MAAIDPVIDVKNLGFQYGRHAILKNVNFTIEPAALTVIMGLNGSGKSTLLRLVSGLLSYSTGSIKAFGNEIKTLSHKNRARWIGFLPQRHKAVFPFTVEEVVLTGRAAYISYTPQKKDRIITHQVLDRMGILNLAERRYTELSGGEQQLVMIARVLTQQPRLLILDEPTSHLDFRNQIRLMKMLKKLMEEGMAVLVSMHEPNLAFGFGDRHLFLHDKTVQNIGKKNPWDHPQIMEIFGKNAQKIDVEGKSFYIPRSK